jgi:hypothetical protein
VVTLLARKLTSNFLDWRLLASRLFFELALLMIGAFGASRRRRQLCMVLQDADLLYYK